MGKEIRIVTYEDFLAYLVKKHPYNWSEFDNNSTMKEFFEKNSPRW